MPFENNLIVAKNIDDAWRNTMWACVRNGYDYKIEHGSYVGQIRRQLDYMVIKITEPWQRPLAVQMPEGCGIPAPTNEESIQEYFLRYIIGNKKADGEDYTYGMYISQQVDKAIEILNNSHGNSNQATITIGEPNSIYQNDPPCLRVISFKVVNGKLNMSVFFRSWDGFAALPENIGGLQLLKEYVLACLDFDVIDGEIIAYSDGCHLYEMYFDLVNILCVD